MRRAAALWLAGLFALISMPAAAETLGFAVASFARAIARDDGDCPDGLALDRIETFLPKLDAAERARLQRPENGAELLKRAMLGANGQNLCREPDSVTHPPQRLWQGRRARGIALDEAPGCAHAKFQGGIDNQVQRVFGCMKDYRNGQTNLIYDNFMREGQSTILIEVTEVEDVRNDGSVGVAFYAGADPMAVGAQGNVLPDASLAIDPDPHFGARTRGRIENGVLTTDPVDVTLKLVFATFRLDYRFKAARLRLALDRDGNAAGGFYAYWDLENLYTPYRVSGGVGTQVDCPSLYAALKQNADGHPDPATGACTALSAAFDVKAVRAFIIHPVSATAVAEPAASR